MLKVPMLLQSLLMPTKEASCFDLFEPLPLPHCPNFQNDVQLLNYELTPASEERNTLEGKNEHTLAMGMHLHLNFNLKISRKFCNAEDCNKAANMREDLLLIFQIPAGAYVDTRELLVSNRY